VGLDEPFSSPVTKEKSHSLRQTVQCRNLRPSVTVAPPKQEDRALPGREALEREAHALLQFDRIGRGSVSRVFIKLASGNADLELIAPESAVVRSEVPCDGGKPREGGALVDRKRVRALERHEEDTVYQLGDLVRADTQTPKLAVNAWREGAVGTLDMGEWRRGPLR